MIYPLPATMVSCGSTADEYNIITIAWTGTICSIPPMCYISVQPKRHSHAIIERTGAFVINLSNKELAGATDWCGVRSGRDYNKFEQTGLTAVRAHHVNAPLILESPVNIECEVTEIKRLGSHDMFMAKVVAIQCDEELLDTSGHSPDPEKLNLISYDFRSYYEMGAFIGRAGFSIK